MERLIKSNRAHRTRETGITVTDGETDETKKYAVNGIPREYKRSMVSGTDFSFALPHTLTALLPARVSEKNTCM